MLCFFIFFFFFFNDTATTEIYTLSLHDALPISVGTRDDVTAARFDATEVAGKSDGTWIVRSEEHTSELQSRQYLVCRLLLEKKKNVNQSNMEMNRITSVQQEAKR